MYRPRYNVLGGISPDTDIQLDLDICRRQRVNMAQYIVGGPDGPIVSHKAGVSVDKFLEESRLENVFSHGCFFDGNHIPECCKNNDVFEAIGTANASNHSQVAARQATEPRIRYPLEVYEAIQLLVAVVPCNCPSGQKTKRVLKINALVE